jgi:hypothetical protein
VSSNDDRLVADYLSQLASAAGFLPADRRDELIEEISAHIAESRAAGPPAAGEAPGGVAETLARLGRPQDIARAAAEQADAEQPGSDAPAGAAAGPGKPAGRGLADPDRPERHHGAMPVPAGMGGLEITAVVLLLIGVALAGVGWIAGVVLLWISPRWRLSDKLLGTLIWPGGLAAALLLPGIALGAGTSASTCSGSSGPGQPTTMHCASLPGQIPGWLGIVLLFGVLVAGFGGPILVAVRLVRQARRAQQPYPATA